MIDPRHLHAVANLRSLRQSVDRLRLAAASEEIGASDGIQGWRPQTGRSSGGHGDSVSSTALADICPRPNPWAGLLVRVGSTLGWLTSRVGAPAGRDRIEGLELVLPRLAAPVAWDLARWVADLDREVRAAVEMYREDRPVPTNPPCPACGLQLLRMRVALAAKDWDVVCGVPCLCAGEGCPCGMPVRPIGVPHIWLWETITAGWSA